MIDLGLAKILYLHASIYVLWLIMIWPTNSVKADVLGYAGNFSSNGAAVSVGAGSSVSVSVGIGIRIPETVPLKINTAVNHSRIEGEAQSSNSKPAQIHIKPAVQGKQKNSVQLSNQNNQTVDLVLANKIGAPNSQAVSKFNLHGQIEKDQIKNANGQFEGEITLNLVSI